MDKKEFIVRQLARTKNKKYEYYVISRIIHLLNDFRIKFITQQYITRPDGYALTDLFFPQFGLHIEVDESHHLSEQNIIGDKVREHDIVNATNHTIERVNTNESLESINIKIDVIVDHIRNLSLSEKFIPWDFDLELSSEFHVNKGYVDINDDVAFTTIKDACNCFGHSYRGYQKAGTHHPYQPDTILWFPKLFPNGQWNNQISNDENIIIEKSEDPDIAKQHVTQHLSYKEKYKHKRLVFAKVKGSLGDILYRFKGLYELDTSASNLDTGLVWRRTSIRVATYKPK